MPRRANGKVESRALPDPSGLKSQSTATRGFWITLSCIVVLALIAQVLLAGVEVSGPFFTVEDKERLDRPILFPESGDARVPLPRNEPQNDGSDPQLIQMLRQENRKSSS